MSQAEEVLSRCREKIRLVVARAGKVSRIARNIEGWVSIEHCYNAAYIIAQAKELSDELNRLTIDLQNFDKINLIRLQKIVKELREYDTL